MQPHPIPLPQPDLLTSLAEMTFISLTASQIWQMQHAAQSQCSTTCAVAYVMMRRQGHNL